MITITNRMPKMLSLALVLFLLASSTTYSQHRAPKNKKQPIRILVADPNVGTPAIVDRLKKLKFQVKVIPQQKLDPDRLELIDVIFLPTQWTEHTALYNHLESKKKAFHAFMKRGGGLLVCQPNPPTTMDSVCTPSILPYPITFKNWYDDAQPERKNLNPDHYITNDLPAKDMPFPADPILEIDRRYTILAKQISTGSPSLAVCQFGDGRVVVQTANENYGASIPISDEILRRMIVWAAGREKTTGKDND